MANSYRRQATTEMIPVMEAKRAESPKASGPYMRVMKGEAKIPRTWAMAVPPTSLRTSDAKEGITDLLKKPSKRKLFLNKRLNKTPFIYLFSLLIVRL